MGLLLGVIAAIGVMIVFGWVFSRMETGAAQKSVRILLAAACLIFGIGLTVRGLAVIGVPLAGAGIGFLGVALGFRKTGDQTFGDEQRDSARAPASPRMSVREALEVLGLGPEASDDDVRAAYRELMKKVHPDAGGTNALAARVRQARDVLLGE